MSLTITTLLKNRNFTILFPFLLSILIVVLDFVSGSEIHLNIFYVLPVLFSAWYNGIGWSIIFALILPLSRIFMASVVEPTWSASAHILNAFDRICVLIVISILTTKLSNYVNQLEQKALRHESLLPVCSSCKNIRDEDDHWHPMEQYFGRNAKVKFTHGICPECAYKLYPDFIKVN